MTARLSLLLAAIAVIAPTDAASADARPHGEHRDLVADRTIHDFGVAAQGQELETTFTITNRGPARVEGLFAVGECGCNELRLGATELDPGAATELKVIFRTQTTVGPEVKRIRVRTADTRAGELHLEQRIAVVAGLLLSPRTVTFLGAKRGSTPAETVRLRWVEGHGTPFRILSASVPGESAFETTIRPYADPNDPAWKGYEVDFRFAAPAVEGTISAEAVIVTDHPDHPRLVLPLYANVSGAVWVQSRTLHFGAHPAGAERVATIRFRPTSPDTPFGEVRARARVGRVRVEVGPDPVHFDRGGYWFLRATLLADTPPGTVRDEIVDLDVGIEGEAPIEIEVRATVLQPTSPPPAGSAPTPTEDRDGQSPR